MRLLGLFTHLPLIYPLSEHEVKVTPVTEHLTSYLVCVKKKTLERLEAPRASRSRCNTASLAR